MHQIPDGVVTFIHLLLGAFSVFLAIIVLGNLAKPKDTRDVIVAVMCFVFLALSLGGMLVLGWNT